MCVFWQPVVCSRSKKKKKKRKQSSLFTLIQLLANRENSKKLEHKIIFSFCFSSTFPTRLNQPQRSLESPALFLLYVPPCLLAYVGEAASLTCSLLCWGWMNVFFERLLSIWLCNILLNPCGVCPMVLLFILLRNISPSLAAPFPVAILICWKVFLMIPFCKAMGFQWLFKASQGVWRESKAD